MEKGNFHESLDGELIGVKVTLLNPQHDTVKPLEGRYFRITGVPTYIARHRRLGVFANNCFELLKVVPEEEGRVRIEHEGVTVYSVFTPVATTSEKAIIHHAVKEFQNDLMADVFFNFDAQP